MRRLCGHLMDHYLITGEAKARPFIACMKLLWLTLADPHPADNGQFLYSAGLLRAAEMNGCAPCVIALRRPDVQGVKPSDSTVKWNLATHRPRSKWRALISRSPMLASRTKTATMRRLLRRHLRAESWDAIVFDGIAVGWAITPIIRQTSIQNRRPKLVYLSHNHEERVARFMARQGTSVFKRVARHIDAFKIARLERKLVRHADLVTANTPEDRAHFAEMRPGRAVEFVPPGYSGPLTEERSVGADTPRRAIIVGSFHWGPKQRSMESFLKAADPIFADAGVELLIVGDSEKAFLDRLRPNCARRSSRGAWTTYFPICSRREWPPSPIHWAALN